MKPLHPRTSGFSLLEIIAVLGVLGVLVTIVATRVSSPSNAALRAACEANQAHIELQAEIWRRNTGNWPTANLSNIGASLDYFPSGLPTCPIDSNAYTIDSLTGKVNGHNH